MSNLIEFDKLNRKEKYLIGTDEAGRGPAAGPVFAAAVCFVNEPEGLLLKLNDSKKLTESKREYLFEEIINNSIYSIQFPKNQQFPSKLTTFESILIVHVDSILFEQKLQQTMSINYPTYVMFLVLK